jgi:type I restriction enzyme, S subunit
VQRGIVDVLGGLDEKIELNRQSNETLEQMAQAIFRDWFVDFGPVLRKRVGVTGPVAIMGGLVQDNARAANLAAQFPEAFGDDCLPESWRVARIGDFLDLAYGRSLPKTVRTDGPVPVYGSGGVTATHIEGLVSGPGIVVGRKGTVGSLYWIQSNFFPIDTVFYVEPKQDQPLELLWFILKSLGLEHMNTDAAVPGLNRNNVYRLEFPLAPPAISSAFFSIASMMRRKSEANLNEASRNSRHYTRFANASLCSFALPKRWRSTSSARLPF